MNPSFAYIDQPTVPPELTLDEYRRQRRDAADRSYFRRLMRVYRRSLRGGNGHESIQTLESRRAA